MKKLVVAALVGAGLVATALAPTAAQARQVGTQGTARTQAAPGGLKWSPCTEANLKGFDCATLKVPLDHRNPKGAQISLALSRFKHTGTAAQYQGPLVVNPGGPGGSGRNFTARVANRLPADLKAAYDVIGFDPRGVGASSPSLSCDPNYFAPVRPDYLPVTAKLEATWLKRSAGYARHCAKYGSLLSHMKSTDVVKDIDLIRVALGQKQINYYGASYGTYLGSVYATLFPARVRRMVLDSNVRVSGVWYDANLDQDVAFEKNLNALFAWIAKYDSVYHVGTTKKAVRKFYFHTRATLVKTPLNGVVGGDELDDTYLPAAYINLGSYWPYLANALSKYKAGDGAPLVAAYNALGANTEDNGFAVYNSVQCTDVQWPKSWKKWKRDNWRLYHRGYKLQTWANAWYNAPCLFWPAKAGKPVNVGHARGLPKILLFQATHDGPTPFPGGIEMNKRLKGSRLVIEDGGRTHGVVQRGNACIDDKFHAFLGNGTLPANRSHCAHLPDPVPPAGARTYGAGQFPDIIGRP